MKKLSFLLILTLSLISIARAQDTIKVQTFTWDDNHRVDSFDFPDDPDQKYRKILMKYNMPVSYTHLTLPTNREV